MLEIKDEDCKLHVTVEDDFTAVEVCNDGQWMQVNLTTEQAYELFQYLQKELHE